jgi:hypothetical protein
MASAKAKKRMNMVDSVIEMVTKALYELRCASLLKLENPFIHGRFQDIFAEKGRQ